MKHFTYYTIIGKDINLLKGHAENVKKYAGFDSLKCPKEFLVIVYKNSTISEEVTQTLLDYCSDNNIRTVIYDEDKPTFMDNLYHCWNLGYSEAKDGYVFRGGSDQVFSKDSFISLYNLAEELDVEKNKITLQANTMECFSRLRMINAVSRHFERDYGYTYDTFDYPAFEKNLAGINSRVTKNYLDINEALSIWGHPTSLETTLGKINRCDGCSWLMTKAEWEKYGPIPVTLAHATGDVAIHDILQQNGYTQYIDPNCMTYHFVQGERT